MGFDKRSVPGPGHYQPRRKRDGGACNVGESPGAYSATPHGASLGGGVSKDFSLSDCAQGSPWLTYNRQSVVSARKQLSDGTYANPTAFGEQPDSKKRSAGRPVIGTDPIASDKPPANAGNPPPNLYDLSRAGALGEQAVSTRPSAPHFTIAGRIEPPAPPHTPGPAAYRHDEAAASGGYYDTSRRAVMDRAERGTMPSSSASVLTGPGLYATEGSLGAQTGAGSPPNAGDDDGDPVFVSKRHVQDKFGRAGPGPLAYDVRMTYKGITLLKGRGRKGITFTKDKKDGDRPAGRGTPGPNSYSLHSTESMGRQVLSSSLSCPGVPKSSMERANWNKVFVSKDHTIFDLQGRNSPGPVYFVDTNARGGTNLSKLAKSKGNSFGKQPQRPASEAGTRTPGPGSYVLRGDFDAKADTRGSRPATSAGVVPTFNFAQELRACLKEFDEISPRGDQYMGQDAAVSQSLGLDAPGPGTYQIPPLLGEKNAAGGVAAILEVWDRQAEDAQRRGGERGARPGALHDTDEHWGAGGEQEGERAAVHADQGRQGRGKDKDVHWAQQQVGGGGSGVGPGPQKYSIDDKWMLNSKKRRGPSFGFGTEARTSSFLYA
eukprot:CAMPEP_0173471704 /NCGR_PEP_ID=MMETSP1357-20121228/78528_1 /TAXON_ID=77926 /ORGANISM="Hemiselmis rufescens, Strain PCC563" /LENGTH=602 /DNA_ID=CAMNT_0014440017 /DNA_START=41 /DNA_END=1849 /DNA_ORIENTATION=-